MKLLYSGDTRILDLLESVGAIQHGHYVFASGLHSDTFVNKSALYPYTRIMREIGRAMSAFYVTDNVEAVIGPATGGVALSQWVADYLTECCDREVLSVYADKVDNDFEIARGFSALIEGKRTVVVEDLVTTGTSLRRVVLKARAAGAEVIGAVALCNRGGIRRHAIAAVPRFDSLINLELKQWAALDCPLCKGAVQVNTDLGHGREFLAESCS